MKIIPHYRIYWGPEGLNETFGFFQAPITKSIHDLPQTAIKMIAWIDHALNSGVHVHIDSWDIDRQICEAYN